MSAEGNNSTERIFHTDDVEERLWRQGFKVQAICCVEIGGNGLRVVIDDNNFISGIL